jgi:hypothetical protein
VRVFLLRENAWGPQDNGVGPVEPDLDVWSQPNEKNFACSRGCGYLWANCVLIITYILFPKTTPTLYDQIFFSFQDKKKTNLFLFLKIKSSYYY